MTTQGSGLNKKQLGALLAASQRAGIAANRLSPKNPWLDDSPTAKSLQIALLAVDPAMAEELQREAGANAPLSLMATAYEQGVEGVELTAELRQELQMRRPAAYAQIRAKELEAASARFAEQMASEREARAAMQEQIKAQEQDARIRSLQLVQNSLRPEY